MAELNVMGMGVLLISGNMGQKLRGNFRPTLGLSILEWTGRNGWKILRGESMGERYILDDDGNPVEEPDLMKWAEWIERGNRIVAQDYVGDYCVSTVFLGLNHNFRVEGPPILWETMTFLRNGDVGGERKRYTSLTAARHGHAMMCDWARLGRLPIWT